MINSKRKDERVYVKGAVRRARGLFHLGFALAWLLCAACVASAQTLDVKIRVVSTSPARVHVEGRRQGGATNWSFRNFYGGGGGPPERIEEFAVADVGGGVVC